MDKYVVEVDFVFSGKFFVDAIDKDDALRKIENHCGLVLGGNIHSTLPDDEIEWDFPVHPDKQFPMSLGRRIRKMK
jgi:hypothetical protein